jgi:4-coumarate--CoA ligase
MYHAMAQTIYIAGGVKRSIPVYVMPKFDFVKVLEAIQNFRITSLSVVPPIIVVGFLRLP